MDKIVDPSTLLLDYEGKRSTYIAFTKSLRQLIRDLLASADIEVLAVESRTKTRKSLGDKLRREDKIGKYKSLEEVTDLSGIRVIAYLREDCKTICELIRSNFHVDEKNSIDKTMPDEVDKFGYSSHHIVGGFNSQRTKLPEFAAFKHLKAEFQIRTVLQHAWAVLDWQFRYKSTDEAPAEVRRKLYRISAFLEGADENFSEVHSAVTELRKEYKSKVKSGDLDIQLNADSLAEFFKNNAVVNSVHSTYLRKGFTSSDNSLKPEGLSRSLRDLDVLGISRLAELESRIKKVKVDVDAVATALLQAFEDVLDFKGSAPMSVGGAVRVTLLADASQEDFERLSGRILEQPQTIEIMRIVRSKLNLG